MSGVFRAEQHTDIDSTDDEQLARQFGLTEWDEDRAVWVKPSDNADDESQADDEVLPQDDDEADDEADDEPPHIA